jgi:hypothetical protein
MVNGMPANLFDFFKPPVYESLEQTQKAGFLHATLRVVTPACLITGVLNIGIKSHLDIFPLRVSGMSFI